MVDLGSGTECPAEPQFVKQVISAAPKLKKLRGSFSSSTLEGLPEGAYKLLDGFILSIIGSAQEEKNCLELATAEPALSNLNVNNPLSSANSQNKFKPSFSRVLETLLDSSCRSLVELQTGLDFFHFNFSTSRSCTFLEPSKLYHRTEGSVKLISSNPLMTCNYCRLYLPCG